MRSTSAATSEHELRNLTPQLLKTLEEFVAVPRGADRTLRVGGGFPAKGRNTPRGCETRETGGLPRVTFPGVDSRSAPVFMTIPRYPQRGELVLPLREKLFWWWRPGQENATFEEFPARVYVAGGHRLDMIWRIKPAITFRYPLSIYSAFVVFFFQLVASNSEGMCSVCYSWRQRCLSSDPRGLSSQRSCLPFKPQSIDIDPFARLDAAVCFVLVGSQSALSSWLPVRRGQHFRGTRWFKVCALRHR